MFTTDRDHDSFSLRRVAGPGVRGGAVLAAAALAVSGMLGPVATAAGPAPADLPGHTGRWMSHGRVLELRDDGTGTFSAWIGARDGTHVDLSRVPAPGPAEVSEVTGVRTQGAGAMSPSEAPGVGALVQIGVDDGTGVAHVEWSSGPRSMTSDLCPTTPLTREQMEILHCGA